MQVSKNMKIHTYMYCIYIYILYANTNKQCTCLLDTCICSILAVFCFSSLPGCHLLALHPSLDPTKRSWWVDLPTTQWSVVLVYLTKSLRYRQSDHPNRQRLNFYALKSQVISIKVLWYMKGLRMYIIECVITISTMSKRQTNEYLLNKHDRLTNAATNISSPGLFTKHSILGWLEFKS